MLSYPRIPYFDRQRPPDSQFSTDILHEMEQLCLVTSITDHFRSSVYFNPVTTAIGSRRFVIFGPGYEKQDNFFARTLFLGTSKTFLNKTHSAYILELQFCLLQSKVPFKYKRNL
jgi:hypothetical protein